MTTIEKKVEITESHRLLLDLTLPADLPPGEANVRVTITPAAPALRERKAFQGLAGSLAETGDFAGDAVEIQRRMRDEW